MARPEIFIPEGVARYVKLDRLRVAADASSGLRELLIPHSRFEEVMHELTLHQLKWRPDTIDGESRCLLIFGRTRAGKSVPLRHFFRQYPAFRDEHGMVRRVLYVSAPSGADRHSLQRRLLDALGLHIKVSADEATMIIARHLRLQRIELLIIDEFNHLADLRSSEKQYLAGDMLKEFTNFNSCQLVFCGLESSLDVLSANKQLFHRSPKRFEVRRYDWTIKDDRIQFQEFLDELADAMPFRRRPGLDDDNVAARIASATGGLVGIAVELVALATEIAALAGSAVFRLDHLAAAYDALKPPKLPGNPFRGALTKARFDETFADIVSRGIEDRIDLARKRLAA